MKKILIIGGGLSGLASAVNLMGKGFQVEILEASPKLGGRTYSFRDEKSSCTIDNGQHILMGCYTDTLSYIDKIDSRSNFDFQESLKINYVTEFGEKYKLFIPKNIYPINQLYSFLRFKLLSFRERKEVLQFLFNLNSISKKIKDDISLKQLLTENKQSSQTIIKFWEMVVVSAMNTPIEQASAILFLKMIKIIFFSGEDSSKIIIPKVGLSEALIDPAERLISENGGIINCNERVREIEFNGDEAVAVKTNKRIVSDFEILVSAIPGDKLENIVNSEVEDKIKIPSFKYSPILSVNLWLDNNPLEGSFFGLIGGEFHWLFNKKDYVTLIKSSAFNTIDLDKKELIKLADSELRKYFPILIDIEIVDANVIKERKATYISDAKSVEKRNEFVGGFGNLFIAGDWINTGLPSTIESAVKSGKMVAEKIFYNS